MKKKSFWALGAAAFTSGVVVWAAFQYFPTASNGAPSTSEASANTTVVTTPSTSTVLGKDIPGLPEYCVDKPISVSGCDGKTEITTEQGNTYRLVEIGDQCWFADNLKEIPTTNRGWYGYYDNADEEHAPGEGLLYTWEAAMNGETEERAQGICPKGWHIPSRCETLNLLKLWGASVENDRTVSYQLTQAWSKDFTEFKTGYRTFTLSEESIFLPAQRMLTWTSSKQIDKVPTSLWLLSPQIFEAKWRSQENVAVTTKCILSS